MKRSLFMATYDVHSVRRLISLIAATGAAAATAACSGGGGAPAVPVPVVGVPAPVAPASSATGTLTFSIAVPGRTASSRPHRRVPAYVSASTAKVQITVQSQTESTPEAPQTFACTSVCSGSFVAPAGVDRIALQLQDTNAKPLSSGISTVIVFAGQSNSFAFTLDGVVASVDLAVTSAKLPVVPAANGYVLFNARDADGNIVTYNGAYADANDAPLVFDLTSSDPNFVLSSTTVSGPGSVIPYAYDGLSHVGKITLSGKLHPGTSASSAPTFAPASIALVPGILKRLLPPEPLTVNGVMQTGMNLAFAPVPASVNVISGEAATGAALLDYAFATGTYEISVVTPGISGNIAGPPVIAYGTTDGNGRSTDGISGYVSGGSSTFSSFGESATGENGGGNAVASPCTGNIPLGIAQIGPTATATFCDARDLQADVVFERSSASNTSAAIASGTPRKILVDGTSAYVQTFDEGSPEVWGANVKFANAISLGLNVTAVAAPYLGRSDGTVVQAGSTTPVATFSAPVTAIVAALPSVYALEGRVFGYANGATVSETDPLPIGVPFDLMTAPGGAPIIVEADGTLDVMAL